MIFIDSLLQLAIAILIAVAIYKQDFFIRLEKLLYRFFRALILASYYTVKKKEV